MGLAMLRRNDLAMTLIHCASMRLFSRWLDFHQAFLVSMSELSSFIACMLRKSLQSVIMRLEANWE